MTASHALSQLSYGPEKGMGILSRRREECTYFVAFKPEFLKTSPADIVSFRP